MDETRNELEVGNETMVMMYLNILKLLIEYLLMR